MIVELFFFALKGLSGHRLRSTLCLLGMAIGVAAVIVLTALGEGARRYVTEQFSSIGSNLLIVLPGRTETSGTFPGTTGVPNDLTLGDTRDLGRRLHRALRVAPVSMGTESVSFAERRRQVAVIGTTRDYGRIRDLELAQGRFLPELELERQSPVAVLGWRLAQELFDSRNPVGQVVRIGDWRTRVIGVLAPQGVQLGFDVDDMIVVPVATAMGLLDRSSLFRILIELAPASDFPSARREVIRILSERHGEEDFTCLTQDSVVETLSSILGALTLALAAIASVSLTVAGIGIMNVMLVSVSERGREVGLLRAVGVMRHQILTVFLLEAAALALAGGLAGLALGGGTVRLLVALYPALPASPPVWAVLSALGVSVGVGIVFGILPARRATYLDPVEALSRR